MTENNIMIKNSGRSLFKGIKKHITRIARDQSGLAAVEFALVLPIFMGLGMYGAETAFLASTNTKLSQAALTLADNASRLGQTDTGIATTITDFDVAQVFRGLSLQTSNIALLENGRVILSSLEVHTNEEGDEQQYIHWQRCKGVREAESAYGEATTPEDADPSLLGLGNKTQVAAVDGTAVMFVEIEYKYQPLFGTAFHTDTILRQEAAFNIRDDRTLKDGLLNNIGSKAATCDKFDAEA
jgi:Flp pilus assembly pilin Flp